MSDEVSVKVLRDLVQRQQTRIDDLEKRVQLAERQVEAAEQYSRQDCLILRGNLNIRSNCSLRDEVMRIIQHHTGIQFHPWCMNTAHWLGKGDSIIVRFNNKGVRDAVYRNRVPKEVNKRGLFIHESLTSAKTRTISKCAKLRRDGKLATYFTQSGNVFIKKSKEVPAILIPDNLSEQEILQRLEEQPSSYREAVVANREEAPELIGTSSVKHTENQQTAQVQLPPTGNGAAAQGTGDENRPICSDTHTRGGLLQVQNPSEDTTDTQLEQTKQSDKPTNKSQHPQIPCKVQDMTQTPETAGQTSGQVSLGATQSTADGQTPGTGPKQSDLKPQRCFASVPQTDPEKLGSDEDQSKKHGKKVGDKDKVTEKSRPASGQSEDTLSDESSSSQKKNQPRRSKRKKANK